MLAQRRENGFMLIEIMIAVFIISIALLTLAWLLLQSNRALHRAQMSVIAVSMAQEQLELLKNRADSEWQLLILPASLPLSGSQQDGFFVQTMAEQEAGAENLVRVTVKVSWQESAGEASVQLSTLYAKIH